jgi:hypothetical protein
VIKGDWSSDVCSSDLSVDRGDEAGGIRRGGLSRGAEDESEDARNEDGSARKGKK